MTTRHARPGDLVVVLVLAGHLLGAVLRAAAGLPDGRVGSAVVSVGVAVALAAILRRLWRRARDRRWQAIGLVLALAHTALAGRSGSMVFLLTASLLVLIVVDRLEALRVSANGVSAAS